MPSEPTPREDGKVVPAYIDFSRVAKSIHFHTHNTGGEIAWNNLQITNFINSIIRNLNRAVPEELKDSDPNKSHIPYLAVPATPTVGFNIHHHTNEFDGGAIFGMGLHDHRDNANGGFAYATYHPGTNLPKLSYEEEVVVAP